MSVVIPIRIESEQNMREHWAKKSKRIKQHREATRWHLWAARVLVRYPVTVRMIRIAPRDLDTDNLASGFKATRDGIADYFRVDDNDPRIGWTYAQERGQPKEYACRIEFS